MGLFDMHGCQMCSLRHEWKNLSTPVMPMFAPKETGQIRVMVVGEQPFEEDDRHGEPFSGSQGRFFKEHFKSVSKNFYWTNLVRCYSKKGRPSDSDLLCCTSKFLVEDLKVADPHVIIAVGDYALRHFIGGFNTAQLRGIPIPYEIPGGNTCWVYPIFDHYYIRKGGELDALPGTDAFNPVYPVFKSDVKRFFNLAKKFLKRPRVAIPPTREEIFFPKTKEEAQACLDELQSVPTIDIETSKKKPYMLNAKLLTAAISDGKFTFAFPVEWPNGPTWGKEFLGEFLAEDRNGWGWKAHNAAFELCWFWYRYRKPLRNYECTMMKSRFIYQRTKILSLETQSQIHLGTPIKDEADQGMLAALRKNNEGILMYPMEEVLYYNALDAWSQALLDEELVLPDDQIENYACALDTALSTTAMELYGLPLDMKRSYELKTVLRDKMNVIEKEANSRPECLDFEWARGRKVSLTAPDDIAEVIIRFLKMELPKGRGEGKYSTDEDALSKLDCIFAQLVLDHRECAKQLSTYVEPILTGQLVGSDGLLHPSYTVVHTATLRLSGVDPNVQNWPKRKNKEVREQIIPPEGCIIAAFDYGQLEARGLSMASGDIKLRQSFINKEDIHTKWLNKILEYYPKYFDRLRQKTGEKDEKSLRKAGRDTIKTDFVFASFYGSKITSVASRTLIPEPIVAEVWHEFWAEYGGVLSWQKGQFQEYADTGYITTLTEMVRNEIMGGNEPINTPIQGLGARIVLEAQNALCIKALSEDIHFLPRINIHDDLVFFLPDGNDTDRYIEVIGQEIVLPRFSFSNTPLMTECRVGFNWANLEAVAKFEGAYLP